MLILGLNAYHGDSSACIIRNGELIAAVEEERFTRIKHWAGMPIQSIQYCLKEAGADIRDIGHIAFNRNPRANAFRKAAFVLKSGHSLKSVLDRLKNASRLKGIKEALSEGLGSPLSSIKADIHPVEHHIAHLASTFYTSPFDEATAVSIDGFGDFVGAMWAAAKGNTMEVMQREYFPHSLGLFYLAITQYLGFPKYGDEYKVMGLAAYGEPSYEAHMNNIARESKGGMYKLNLDYFTHHKEGVSMTWEEGEPEVGAVFSTDMEKLLGVRRNKAEDISQRHKDIACSLQKRYEDILFSILNKINDKTDQRNLVLSGGCAMNSLANGKIFDRTNFKEVYIQPAAGDAGGAIGAAYHVWHAELKKPRSFVLDKPYLGPSFTDAEIKTLIDGNSAELIAQGCKTSEYKELAELCSKTARKISEGCVIGWFQGRMEWGPRALGNRSILSDPRRTDMKDILNLKIKRRESFRPFAPSIHLNAVSDYFECSYPDPFMLKVYVIKPEKRAVIPAVTHADGTGRLQTVRIEDNPLYYQLIDEFNKITGVPVLLNTSFNENEPIVCKPEEALDCFLRTKMDVLVMGSYFISRE